MMALAGNLDLAVLAEAPSSAGEGLSMLDVVGMIVALVGLVFFFAGEGLPGESMTGVEVARSIAPGVMS